MKMHDFKEQVLTPEVVGVFRKELLKDSVAQLAMNACLKTNPNAICLKRDVLHSINHVFSHKIETEGKPISNQHSSGRCWIFACLNAMRLPFMKKFNIEEFEFSHACLFFWDKMERANYFLSKIVSCYTKSEPIDGRLVSYLLVEPSNDGGQWDMLVNLIAKYGLMPKKCFLESYCSEHSNKLNKLLNTKLREYARDIYDFLSEGNTDVSTLIKKQMKEVYRMVAVCLGVPPETFTWEYYDKDKKYHTVGPITPFKFYEDYVKPVYDIEDKICLVNDPRPSSPFNHTFTINSLGNMVNGREVLYNNQPIDILLSLATESVKAGEAVWFGCEVSKRSSDKYGIHDTKLHDYKSLFGVDVGMTKSDRLLYGDLAMSHAMLFTAVSVDPESGETLKLRVENSWGDERGEKGFHVFTKSWFEEFVLEVVVDKKFVSEEVLKVLELKPIVLPAWDPMGSLAR